MTNMEMVNLQSYKAGDFKQLFEIIETIPEQYRQQFKDQILQKLQITEEEVDYDKTKSVKENLINFINQRLDFNLDEFIKSNNISEEETKQIAEELKEEYPVHSFFLKKLSNVEVAPQNAAPQPGNFGGFGAQQAINFNWGQQAAPGFNFGVQQQPQQPFGLGNVQAIDLKRVENLIKNIKKLPFHQIRQQFFNLTKQDQMKLFPHILKQFKQSELQLFSQMKPRPAQPFAFGDPQPRPQVQIKSLNAELVSLIYDMGGLQFLYKMLTENAKLNIKYDELVEALNTQQLKEFGELMVNNSLKSMSLCALDTVAAQIKQKSQEEIEEELDEGIKQSHVVLALNPMRFGQLKLKQQEFQIISSNFAELSK